jgi:hypothetical protein
MNETKVRRMQGERGASLLLAIAFMVVVGAISAAVLATTASGLQDRIALDQARDREYAADGAIEAAVTSVRNNGGNCASFANVALNGVTVHVDCASVPAFIAQPDATFAVQNNFVFTACQNSDVVSGSCPAAKAIINAQVNFQGTSAPLKTFVQSWSVNR